MKKVLLKIDGMTCSACSSGLEKYLNKQDGIKTAVVNLVLNNANIEYDEKKLTLEQVEKFVEKAGFTSLGIDNFEKLDDKIQEKSRNDNTWKIQKNGRNIEELRIQEHLLKHFPTSKKLKFSHITIWGHINGKN